MGDVFAWIFGHISTAMAGNDFFTGGILLAGFGILTGALYRVVGPAKAWMLRRFTINIEVRDREPFRWIAEWLALEATNRRCRLLSVYEDSAYKPGVEENRLTSKAVFVPGLGAHLFWKGGWPIRIVRSLDDATESSAGGFTLKVETFTLTALGGDPAVLRDVVLEAERAYRERRNHKLSVWCDDGYGGWDERELQDGRPIESVILKGDMATSILGDVEDFLSASDRYVRVGAPYRRGYLFHGPPGCGKTSLAKALATETRMDLYLLTLSASSMTDDKLIRKLAEVRRRSIVLLEDVDVAFRDRGSGKKKGVTFSGLLNAIDGVTASQGRLLIMTTNYPDRLDAALIRPGRADVHYELGPTDADMARRLFLRFFSDEPEVAEEFGYAAEGATPATIQVHLFEHWGDAMSALAKWERSKGRRPQLAVDM